VTVPQNAARVFVALLLLATAPVAAGAQATGTAPAAAPSPSPTPSGTATASAWKPQYTYLPDEEYWKPFCNPASRSDPIDSLKCIPLSGTDSNIYATLGIDVREKYEHFFNKDWNPTNDGYLLQRYLLDVDLHEDRLREFVELEYSTATNPHAPIDATWQDDFASTSAYAEYAIGGVTGAKDAPLELRVGRQRLAYGSERMIDDRSGLNTIQPFDGVRARINTGTWRTDLFYLRPVTVAPYGFDDLANKSASFFGGYATHTFKGGSLDAYAFVDQRPSQFYYRGVGREIRDTLGTRYATNSGPFDSDTELDWQFGSFKGDDIDAFAIETNVGYALARGRNRFRLGLGGGIASGDHDPKSSHFTTFRAPYPTGLTFGIIEANGNENTSGFTPNVSYTFNKKVTVAVKAYFFYRQSLYDGIYSAPGYPLRAPAGSNASPIGNLGYTSLVYVLDRHVQVIGAYARYLKGAFLDASPEAPGVPSLSTAYYSAWFEYKL
jgi:hypothetical protein